MPESPAAALREFHTVFGLTIGESPAHPAPDVEALRQALIDEEHSELVDAVAARDLVAIADALADIVYVAYGTALSYGIDLDAVLAEVHRSNMSKLGPDGHPLRRADGKAMKGEAYRPPDVAGVLGIERDA